MEHQTPQKALLLSLFSLLVFTASAHAFMEADLADAADQLKAKTANLAGHVKGKAASLADQAKDQMKGKAPSPAPAAQPPLASSPTAAAAGSAAGSADPVIKELCGATDYPTECIEAITPYLDGNTEPRHMTGFAIRGAIDHTNKAIEEARRMSKEARSPAVATIVNEVRESYEDALENFQKAMEALDSNDIGTVNSMLSAAITDFSDNEDKISGRAGTLVRYDDKLSKMTSNCLALVSLLH